MEEFYTIDQDAEAEIVEKKSKFISHLFYVETIEQAEAKIKEIKKKYHDARHNCFAYAIETIDGGIAIKYNDDGEPSGTAGSPMLKVLLENQITNVLVITTRYFGGILLGTGGLVRAYTDSVLKALEKVNVIKKKIGYSVEIELSYGEFEVAKRFFENLGGKVINAEFLENVKINVEIDKNSLEYVKTGNDKIGFEIKKIDILEEKFI